MISYQVQCLGISHLGVGNIPGQICNIDGREGGLHTTRLRWAWKSSDLNAIVYAYVNGALAGQVAGIVETMDIADLIGGSHSLQLISLSEYETPPMYLTDLHGRQGILYWEPSLDGDTVGYRVYKDSELIAEVRDIVITPCVNKLPHESLLGGSGRITVWGAVPEGLVVNDIMEIEVVGLGEIQYSSSSESETVHFVTGGVLNLTYGVQVGFIDNVNMYQVGDKWTVRIGPKTEYLTDVLPPGDYTFKVSAIDAAGNASAQVSCAPFRILEIPEPVENVIIDYEPLSDEVQIVCDVPAGTNGISLYTNYNPHTNKMEECIAIDGLPFAQSNNGEFSFVLQDQGILKFYLRPFDNNDERDDVRIYSISIPPEPEDLGIVMSQPFGINAVPLAGGKWRLEWFYAFEAGDSVTDFVIYRHAPNGHIDYDNDGFAIIHKSAGEGYPIRKYSVQSDTPETGPVRLAVRATNGTVNTTNTDYVVLIPDSTAPSFSGPVYGGAA